ncbi:MAG: hypothetical protein KDK70_02635 [Myxococcales bacterium]|nr:hypothetical protein [Myxococcales bacterium]
MASTRFTHGLGIGVLLLGACSDDGGGDAETGASTVSADGPTSASSMDATADGSDSAGLLCGDLDDEMVEPAVSIAVVNMRNEGMWLPLINLCYFSVPYTFTGPGGGGVAWVGPDCGTCQSWAQGNCACPGAACSEDVLLYLEPGGVFEGSWSGAEFVSDTLPDTCPGLEQCGATCQRAVQAPAGSYTLEVQAGRTASGCTVEPCACEPFDGRCTVFDMTAAVDDPSPYTAVFDYPSETSVQIVID